MIDRFSAPNPIDIPERMWVLITEGNIEQLEAVVQAWDHEIPEVVLQRAVNRNKPECLNILIPKSNPLHLGHALGLAAEWGFLECVKHLYEHCSAEQQIFALGDAAYEGRLAVLKFYASRCDFKSHSSWPLQMACLGGHKETIDYLYEFSDPGVVFNELNKGVIIRDSNREGLDYLRERIARDAQRALLTQEIGSTDLNRTRKI